MAFISYILLVSEKCLLKLQFVAMVTELAGEIKYCSTNVTVRMLNFTAVLPVNI